MNVERPASRANPISTICTKNAKAQASSQRLFPDSLEGYARELIRWLPGIRIHRFKRQLIRQWRMHWNKNLPARNGCGDDRLHYDVPLLRCDANFHSRCDPELLSIDGV